MWQQKGSIIENPYKLPINKVNYNSDQLATINPLYGNGQLHKNKALCRNKITNKLTGWYKFEFWQLNLENCWIWLENTRLVNAHAWTVNMSCWYHMKLQNSNTESWLLRFKLIQSSLKSQYCLRKLNEMSWKMVYIHLMHQYSLTMRSQVWWIMELLKIQNGTWEWDHNFSKK